MKTSRKILKIAVIVLVAGIGLSLFGCNKPQQQSSVSLEDTIIVTPPPVQVPEITTKTVPEGLVRIKDVDTTIFVELKYATTDNFTKTVLYDDSEAYLQSEAAEMLHQAGLYLLTIRPDLRLLIYDAARPLRIQQKMWDAVKDKPYRNYVANPQKTGLHNYGVAVDITLADTLGNPVDMGTPFDYFGEAASVVKENDLIQRGKLTVQQVDNRKLLREVMRHAGFRPISGEWWHFNAFSLEEAKKRYKLIE
jgi:D-alanyl-D-alanine dipeptidase